jgi:hypothetical protein
MNFLNERSIVGLITDAINDRFKSFFEHRPPKNIVVNNVVINLNETYGDVFIRSIKEASVQNGEFLTQRFFREFACEVEIARIKRDIRIFKKYLFGTHDSTAISSKILEICESIVKKCETSSNFVM